MMSDKLRCKASHMKTVNGHRSDNVILQEYIDHANDTLKLKSAKILQIFANDDDFVLIESANKQMKADDSNKANTAGP